MAATAVMAMSQIGGAYAQSEMMRGQGELARANAEFQATQNEINARFAEMQATEIIKQGDEQAREYEKQVRQTVGSQRAILAAQGIEVDADTALELQKEASEVGALDVETIKNNAWRQAFGYKQEAISQKFQAGLTRQAGKFQQSQLNFGARQTLVAGGVQAIGTGLSSFNRPQAPAGGDS